MDKNSKIYIAGHRGMVGSAIWRLLLSEGYSNLIGISSAELDLRNQQAVVDFFKKKKSSVVDIEFKSENEYFSKFLLIIWLK